MSASLALGPFHPAWVGPQRFFLSCRGERVTDVEFTGEYAARGCAARMARMALPEALQLARRVCGLCSVAHELALCLAAEQLLGLEPPARAMALRCAASEVERAARHLDAAGRVLWAIGMEPRAAALRALADRARGALALLAGQPVAAGVATPGGVERDLGRQDHDELLRSLADLARAAYQQIDGLIDHQALLARTVDVGTLPRGAAEQFGAQGPLARASGLVRDTRVDHPYEIFRGVPLRTITQDGGDLYARLMVLLLEAYESVKLADQLLRDLPGGAWRVAAPEALPRGRGVGLVEAPRGPLRYTLESDGARLSRVQIDPPRQMERLLARTLLAGALIDNVVAIVASADHCAACADC